MKHIQLKPSAKLLNAGNTKTIKGEKLGYRTFGMHLAPFNLSGYNVCKDASDGCAAACLNTAGRGIMPNVQSARIAKTQLFFRDRPAFMARLHKECTAAIANANRAGLTPCFRLNLTSDLPWESIKYGESSILEHFPEVQFYDYTKVQSRFMDNLAGLHPANYHLTYSRSEVTPDRVVDAITSSGGNVAAVFRGELPKAWRNIPVVDGDASDLRFRDRQGVIVGLSEKGLAKKDETGFVIG